MARKSDLLIAAAGAVLWGVFLSVIPIFEGLLLGSVVWLPVFCWRERVRSKKQGFWPGFAFRIGIIAAVIATATVLPLKHLDRLRVGPFPATEVSLAQLAAPLRLHGPKYEERTQTKITLASSNPTWRQAIRAIEEQTGLKVRVGGCMTGVSLLTGSYPTSCSLEGD